MPVKKVTSDKKQVTSRKKIVTTRTSRASGLSVPVYSLAGRASGILSLPKEIFGKEVNEKLLTQALRVYMTNQKKLLASTKTRGEVKGSTAKIYRQKGTGRARHGAIRAPIFVGGGIIFGPKPRKVRLSLPKKMKKASLISALSAKVSDKKALGLTGVEKATGKTKEVIRFLEKVGSKGGALIVTGEKLEKVTRAARNIPRVDVLPVNLINTYEVLRHDLLVITKDAVDKLVRPKMEAK